MDLPPELLQQCFSRCDLIELLNASHVCQQWRANACDCPIFWKTISIDKPKHKKGRRWELEVFHERMYSSKALGLEISLTIYDVEHTNAIVDIVLAHMARIQALAIAFAFPKSGGGWAANLSFRDHINSLARTPAPLLSTFSISSTDMQVRLDSGFPNSAGIRHVSLENVHVQIGRSWSYPSLRYLSITGEHRQTTPAHFFKPFPQLEELVLGNIARTPFRTEFDPPPPRSFKALKLVGHQADYTALFVNLSVHGARIPYIEWHSTHYMNQEQDILLMLDHLPGELEYTITYPIDSSVSKLRYTSLESRAVREKQLNWSTILGARQSDRYEMYSIGMSRVVDLTISVHDTEAHRLVQHALTLTQLTLSVASDEVSWETPGDLAVIPLLEVVCVRAEYDGASMDGEMLYEFLLKLLLTRFGHPVRHTLMFVNFEAVTNIPILERKWNVVLM